MSNSNAFTMQLLDFESMPAATPSPLLVGKVISDYIIQYPEVCRYYIQEASDIESGQLPVHLDEKFVPLPKWSDNGNSLLALAVFIHKNYPDGTSWSFEDLFKILNLLPFNAAIYLFSLFYQAHKGNYRFLLDFERYLETNTYVFEQPFIKHFYHLCRLFSLEQVNKLSQTQLIMDFNNTVAG